MKLTHVERVPTFTVEGHLYAAADGRHFYVFTAGDATVWSAAERNDRYTFGELLVTIAESRAACVRRLERVLNREGPPTGRAAP